MLLRCEASSTIQLHNSEFTPECARQQASAITCARAWTRPMSQKKLRPHRVMKQPHYSAVTCSTGTDENHVKNVPTLSLGLSGSG